MNALRPCPACSRHVRAAEARCPFCEAALGAGPATSGAGPATRLGRAALLAFGAAAATASLAGAACSSGTGPTLGDASAEGGGDGGANDTGAADTRVPDDGNIAMPYGAPPADGRAEIV